MMKRRLLFVLVVLCAGASGVASNAFARDPLLAPARACPNPAVSASERMQIDAMLCYHDYARRHLGLPVLRGAAPLYRSAGLKLRWIVVCRAFSHTPCSRPFVSAFNAVNYTRGNWRAGENLAWGSGSTGGVRTVFEMWLHSPGHRENITRPEWRSIGMSRLHAVNLFGQPDVTLWVVHFGSR
jgi:uncharacterized protein YkwD